MTEPHTCVPGRMTGSPDGIATREDLTLHLRWSRADVDASLDAAVARIAAGDALTAADYESLGLDGAVIALAQVREGR